MITKSFLFVLPALFLFSHPAIAQTPTATPSPSDFHSNLRQLVDNQIKKIRQQVESELETTHPDNDFEKNENHSVIVTQKVEARATGTQIRQATKIQSRRQRAQEVADEMINQLVKRHDNLLESKNKIQSRIDQKVTAGKDLSAAQTKLNLFNQLEASYSADLSALKTATQEISTSSTPLQLLPNFRQLSFKVNQSLRLMRQNLVDTIRLIIKS